MSRRHDLQDATGRIEYLAGRGTIQAWGPGVNTSGSGVPTSGLPGYAPGCIWHDLVNGDVYMNQGTFDSSTWVVIPYSGSGIVTTSLTMSAGAATATIIANTAAALGITDGTTSLISLDTRNTVTGVAAVTLNASPPTITSATGDTFSVAKIGTTTVTLTGTTTVTALDGLGLYMGVPTVTDASAVTVSTLSNLYVALPVAGGMVTGTAIYSAHFAGAILVDGNINVATAGIDIVTKANTATTLEITDGTTSMAAFDSRNTIANVSTMTVTGVAPTIASATATHINASVNIAAKTITYTGGTATTASNGAMLYVGVPTFTDSSAMTITTVSSVFINAVAAAGGMLTITNSYMIHTSVSGCFLTNAGVWTDMACWESGKEFVNRAAEVTHAAIEKVLEKIVPATWKYKAITELPAIDEEGNPTIHRTAINDRGRERVGIVYDDLPDALRCPGEEKAVSTGVLSSFALAAIKMLYERNQLLEERLAKAGL